MKHSRWPLLSFFLSFAAGLAAGELAPAPAFAHHPLRAIQSETLVYRVLAWKGVRVFSMNLGTVCFTLSRDDDRGERQLVLRAEATGGMAAYPYEATLTARLADRDYVEREADSVRTRPGYRVRRQTFTTLGVDFLKMKHCSVPTLCHNPAHFLHDADGSEHHCDGEDCNDPRHYVWHMASRLRSPGRVYDMLAALYIGRGLPVTVGGPAQTIRIVSSDELWDIEMTAEKEEAIAVAAGRFDCLKIVLNTVPANESAEKHASELRGPFGLHDSAGIYIDKATHQLVLIRGTADAGASFQVEVALAKREVQYVGGGGAEAAKP